jgi:plasmid maintenance system antidote protein VapI
MPTTSRSPIITERTIPCPEKHTRYFGTSDHFWMNLQIHHDLEVEKERLKGRLVREVSVLEEAS